MTGEDPKNKTVEVLEKTGFFNMRSGHVTCHFDHEGNVRKVEHHKVVDPSKLK